MDGQQPDDRFEVEVEEGVPHGGLYELEQTTYYHVVDRRSGQIIMTFEGLMEASLSASTGGWDDYRLSGVCGVGITPDGQSVVVTYCDGRRETAPLPPPDPHPAGLPPRERGQGRP